MNNIIAVSKRTANIVFTVWVCAILRGKLNEINMQALENEKKKNITKSAHFANEYTIEMCSWGKRTTQYFRVEIILNLPFHLVFAHTHTRTGGCLTCTPMQYARTYFSISFLFFSFVVYLNGAALFCFALFCSQWTIYSISMAFWENLSRRSIHVGMLLRCLFT